MNHAVIRKLILTALAESGGYAVPEKALLIAFNISFRPPLDAPAFKDHLSWLLDRHLIDYLKDDLSEDDRKFLITEKGQAALKRF